MSEQLEIRAYQSADEDQVVALWALTFPEEPAWNESRSLIQQKLTTQAELFFVCIDRQSTDSRLVGSVIAGYDGVRGWVHKVASHPDYRGQGVAKKLMQKAEGALAALGCEKLNLQVRAQNEAALRFYADLGYTEEVRVSMGKRLRP